MRYKIVKLNIIKYICSHNLFELMVAMYFFFINVGKRCDPIFVHNTDFVSYIGVYEDSTVVNCNHGYHLEINNSDYFTIWCTENGNWEPSHACVGN